MSPAFTVYTCTKGRSVKDAVLVLLENKIGKYSVGKFQEVAITIVNNDVNNRVLTVENDPAQTWSR